MYGDTEVPPSKTNWSTWVGIGLFVLMMFGMAVLVSNYTVLAQENHQLRRELIKTKFEHACESKLKTPEECHSIAATIWLETTKEGH